MREIEDSRDIDAENFYRLVLIVRGIAICRANNLAKFAEQYTNKPMDESKSKSIDDALRYDYEANIDDKKTRSLLISVPIFEADRSNVKNLTSTEVNQHLVIQLTEVLWLLHAAYPKNMALAPVVVPGLTHTEATVHALVEIIHAFTTCDVDGNTPLAAKLYLQLLLSSDTTISFSAKHAIIRVLRPRYKRRRVYIPSPPNCNTPGK